MPLIIQNTLYNSWVKYITSISFVIGSIIAFILVNQKLDSPFIDEIFHLKQCQRYYNYNYHWDNKITTPPGLYYLGFLYSKLMSIVFGVPFSYEILRSLNLIGGLSILPLVLKRVFKKYKNGQFWTVNIISQPLLFTYYHLFYTDIWSTIFIVLSLSLITNKNNQKPVLSGLIGFISLWFRQTNIVWLAFIATVFIDKKIMPTDSIDRAYQFIKKSFQHWKSLLPYLINFILFIIFLKVNGGITLGDKDNHKVELHVVQVFYCFTFINFFTLPIWFNKTTFIRYFRYWIQFYGLNIVLNLALLGLIKYIIDNFTVVHPFLLADNRHYTFYIYRKLLKPKYSQFISIPLYHFATYNIITQLNKLSFISIIAFIMSICLTIIPSPLFEPRYYIIPLIIFRLYIKSNNELLEFIWLNSINIATTFIFLSYEFSWASELTKQRIIW
ncbi:unnamed protein product [Candida verbasci]|uniref:Dol-P-Glc:Glc(2)Man(9)GlcNAc(2)-PP-Dol alpha-1,2-glucosyltransferase n=1 Tax=Candida verbasci TaxID=1227364 RepID=A0A9W4TYA8_9ASCO|nr:unnamed protein product [Candida verbasci]